MLHEDLHRLGLQQGLDAGRHRVLMDLLRWVPPSDPAPLRRGLALVAALLGGLGLVMAVAANWDDWSRTLKFGLLQGLLALSWLAAWQLPALRRPAALLGFVALGVLLAYFGQTYQTGADPWQLFALWALLALPMLLALREALLWQPWCAVLALAVALAVQTHGGHRWLAESPVLLPPLLGALLLGGLSLAFWPRWAARFGIGLWSWRFQLLLSLGLMLAWTWMQLLPKDWLPAYAVLGLPLIAALLLLARLRDALGLSAATVAVNLWLLGGLARWMFGDLRDGDWVGRALVYSLLAALLLAASVAALRARLRSAAQDAGVVGDQTEAGAAERGAVDRQRLLAEARAAGLVDAQARWPEPETEAWPTLLPAVFGAWFVAVPLLGAIATLLGGWLERGPGLLFVGLALLLLAALLLREGRRALFVEQLGIPLLLTAWLCLGWFLHRHAPAVAAWLLLAAGLAVQGLAGAMRTGLRALLGAAAAACVLLAGEPWEGALLLSIWLPAVGLLALWAGWAQRAWPPAWAQAGEAWGAGLLLTVLVALAASSGSAWLASGLDPLQSLRAWTPAAPAVLLPALGSLVLALAALGLMRRHWPALRGPRWLLAALLLAPLCLLMPALGPIAFAAWLCVAAQRWLLAACAGLAALWTLGSFYYRLDWLLIDKALGLLALGALLGLLMAWWPRAGEARQGLRRPAAGLGLLLSLALALLVVNTGIWRKEGQIADGEPLLVQLAPVDPRSLMQGDYMRLDYALPQALLPERRQWQGGGRPRLLLRRDARGVAEFLSLDDGRALAADERRLELTPQGRGWVIASNAWFFREGEGGRWQAARYAEFRVDAEGRALLVGLRDAALQPL